MPEAEKVLEWEGTDGRKRNLLIVEGKNVPDKEDKQKTIEVCYYDNQKQKWETENIIDHVQELQSFGIPEDFLD